MPSWVVDATVGGERTGVPEIVSKVVDPVVVFQLGENEYGGGVLLTVEELALKLAVKLVGVLADDTGDSGDVEVEDAGEPLVG